MGYSLQFPLWQWLGLVEASGKRGRKGKGKGRRGIERGRAEPKSRNRIEIEKRGGCGMKN
jgi:hypothetical protein